MRKIFLLVALVLAVSLTLVSCDSILSISLGAPNDGISDIAIETETELDSTNGKDKQTDTESKTEITTEDKTEIAAEESSSDDTDGKTEDLDLRFNLDDVVKNGEIIKGHNPSIQVWNETMQDYRVHIGIDIACSDGAAVYSIIDGEVATVWEDGIMGFCISISSGNVVITYKNLSPESVKGFNAGQKISTGDVIGCVGNSAMVEMADPSHLHLEITVGDMQVDPVDFIK